MFNGLKLYWRQHVVRNRELSCEDSYPCEVIVVQDSTQNKLVLSLKTEIDKMSLQIQNQNQINESLKHEIEKLGRRQHEELKTSIEVIEQTQIRLS